MVSPKKASEPTVKQFFDGWIKAMSAKPGYSDLTDCISALSQLDREMLLEHVTEVKKTDVDFNTFWTENRKHVLGASLYAGVRKFLGVGK